MPADLLSLQDARSRILGLCAPLPTEEVSLEHAVGRCLSETVVARRTLPPWNNSAMDGYAVRSADLAAVPQTLAVIETIFAGARPARAIGAGECARIMTGAPLPEGADAVVMQEHTQRRGEGQVEIGRRPTGNEHVRARGEDAVEGQPLLERSTPLGIAECALLWAQGLTTAPVPRAPRVAILSTGDELCTPDEARGDRIVDTNSPALALALRRSGAEPTLLGIARDTLEDVRRKLDAARGFDVILTSAGVSVGEKDFVREALAELGAQMAFWRVAIKPGKPLAFGQLGSARVFGLPGNPVSSLVTYELFVRPAIRRLLGHIEVEPPRVPGRIARPVRKSTGLTHLVRATVRWKDGELWAEPLPTQVSGAIRSAASATHLIMISESITEVAAGDRVDLLPLSWAA